MDDRRIAAFDAAPWRLIGGSVRGRAHVAAGTRRQDDLAQTCRRDTVVSVLADGAGSAQLSHAGARTVVTTVLAFLCERLDSDGDVSLADLRDAVHAARTAVQAEADDLGHPLHDLASTAIVVAAGPLATKIVQVGDGAVIGRSFDASLRVLTWPDQGEYANTTFFVTDDEPRIQAIEVEALDGFAAFTDGLQHLALDYERREPYAPFFAPFFDALANETNDDRALCAHVETFLTEDARLVERTDDDLTLAVARRR
jgi:hypothetical protein